MVHGLLTDGTIWDQVAVLLAPSARCIIPDLPLGGHRTAMNGADLSPPGLARILAELIERLGLAEVTVVGNDTGTALVQILCMQNPELVSALVLTNGDAFERFPPRQLRPLARIAGHVPGALTTLGLLLRRRLVRRVVARASSASEQLPDHLLDGWFGALRDPRVRADLRTVLRGLSPVHTMAAARSLTGFDRPALVAWGTRDSYFPVEEGERLARALPNGRLEPICGARLFVQLDQPRRVAELVLGMLDHG